MDLPNICLLYARDMPLDLPYVNEEILYYALDMILICIRDTWNMPEIFLRYSWDIPEIYLRHTWDGQGIYLGYTPLIFMRYIENRDQTAYPILA